MIKDAAGAVVASTALYGPKLIGAGSFLDSACRYSYGASVPISGFYQVQVSTYNAVTVPSDKAVHDGADLTINAN